MTNPIALPKFFPCKEGEVIMAEACGQVLLGSGLTVLSHPLMYIKVLVQVSGFVAYLLKVFYINVYKRLHLFTFFSEYATLPCCSLIKVS